MSQPPDSDEPRPGFDSLFARAQNGDSAAWEELFARSYERVRRVVRNRLKRPMRSFLDSTDIANDVYKSLVAKSDRFEFNSFEEFLSFLSKAAEQKVIDEYRKQHRLKRDVSRVHYFGTLSADDSVEGFEPRAHDPTPSQVAVANDLHDQLVSGLNDDERRLIDLKAQLYSTEQAAEETGQHVRSVQRFLQRLRKTILPASGDVA